MKEKAVDLCHDLWAGIRDNRLLPLTKFFFVYVPHYFDFFKQPLSSRHVSVGDVVVNEASKK